MVSRRPDVFSELGSLGSPMNHRNDAFWMSIRLGTSSTFSSLEKVLRTRGEVVSGKAKPPGRARRGNQAGRIRTKGATENPIRGLLLTQTWSVSLAAGWASATGYLQSLYRKPPAGQVGEPDQSSPSNTRRTVRRRFFRSAGCGSCTTLPCSFD